MRIEVDYIASTHADELAGVLTHMLLDDHPKAHLFFDEVLPEEETAIPGVKPILAHPAALLAGRGLLRYIGESSSQLQDHYELKDPWDPQDQTANYTLDEIGDHAWRDDVVVLDSHNSAMPGLRFARVSSLASKRSIAAAHIVGGFTDIVVRDDSFSDRVGNAVVLEESATRGLPDYIDIAKRHYAGLYRLAGESPQSLDNHYAAIFSSLRFYRLVEIPTYAADGTYADYLPSLEGIQAEQAFTPIDVPRAVRQQFDLEDRRLVTASWGYNNMSPVIDKEGRRLYFGSLLCEIAPPVPVDKGIWVRQREMSRRRTASQYDYGIPNLSDEAKAVLGEATTRLSGDVMDALDKALPAILQEAAYGRTQSDL